MLTLMFITNQPQLAKHAFDCGVQRIFVDLEVLGKDARQGHLNTVISRHSLSDVKLIRAAVPEVELLVRLNPLHPGTVAEVDEAIAAGADLLMLPMFHSAQPVAEFSRIVAGRKPIVPLVETAGGAHDIKSLVKVPGLHEIYVGLNDLHLSLGLKFMFEPLADGIVERLSREIRRSGLPFGFGGIARVGEGTLPAELVLGEHIRLGSRSVILSRSFHRCDPGIDANDDFREAIVKLRLAELNLRQRPTLAQEVDRRRLVSIVRRIVAQKQAA